MLPAILATAVWRLPASAQEDPAVEVEIRAATLPAALAELSRKAHVSIGSPGPLPRIEVNPVSGRQTVDQALDRLLARTGYTARRVGRKAWRIERASAPAAAPVARSGTLDEVLSGEIVVTGSKRPQLLDDTPNAVTVFLPGTSMSASVDGTMSVARSIEGLTVAEQGPGQNRVFLRGVADSAFGGRSQSTVAILLDDARVTFSAPDPDIRLVDVERVEVLKGPQGSLYGTGALGGIYRIVTRRADLSAPSFEASAGATASAGKAGFDGSIIANVPLAQDAVGVRLVVYGERRPGWIDTGDRRDANSSSAIGLRASVGLEPAPGWRVDLGGMGQWQNTSDSSYTYADRARSRPAQLPEPHDNDLMHGSIHARYDGPVNVVWSSGYTKHEVRNTFDSTVGAAPFAAPDPRLLKDDNQFTVWDSEVRASGVFGAVAWVGGISHLEATQNYVRKLERQSTAGLEVERQRRASIESAVFGEASVPLSGHLDATLGGRAFLARIEDRRTDLGHEGQQHVRRLGFTPSAALAWRFDDRDMVYVRYASAFRQGGLAQDISGSYEPLDGDELATLSAGWRRSTGRLSIDAGLYRSWWHSVQSDILLAGGRIETQNVGIGAIVGAEATVSAALGAALRLEAGAMVQSAMLEPEDAPSGEEDLRLPVVPSSTFRMAIAHDLTFRDWQITSNLRLLYIGASRLSFDPALDRKITGRWDTGFHIAASRGRWSFGIGADNLFDSKSSIFGYGNPLRLPLSPQFIPMTPRRIRITLTRHG